MNFAGISVVLVGCSVVHSEKVEARQLKYSIFFCFVLSDSDQ